MWIVKVEPMPESGGKRLWKMGVYHDDKLMNYDLEVVTYATNENKSFEFSSIRLSLF